MAKLVIPESKIRGAIFDLDGTLLDSIRIWRKIDEDFLAARGFDVPEDYCEAIGHLSIRATAEYTIDRFKLNEEPQALIDEWMRMAQHAYAYEVELRPRAKEFLVKLKESGVRLAVATGGARERFEPALKRCGIYDLFESFTTLNEVKRSKEFPDIYLRAAEKLGLLPEECTVFEDLYDAICGAKAGGFCTVGVYEKNTAAWEKITKTADYSIRGYEELI